MRQLTLKTMTSTQLVELCRQVHSYPEFGSLLRDAVNELMNREIFETKEMLS